MPTYPSRRQIVAGKTGRGGGTVAPRTAARAPRMGLGRARSITPGLRGGLGGAKAVSGPGAGGGVKGPGGAAAPAPPANVAPTPWNSKAEQIVSGARRKYLDESGNFDLNEQTAKQEFGLDPGFNDYKSNPYSRAALLEQSYQSANRGTMNSAGLQLYSGSTSNALGANRGTRDRNRNDLTNAYHEALQEISVGRTKAAEEKAEREREAEWERITAAESAELDPGAAPAPGKGWRGQAPKGKGAGTIKPWKPPKKGKGR